MTQQMGPTLARLWFGDALSLTLALRLQQLTALRDIHNACAPQLVWAPAMRN